MNETIYKQKKREEIHYMRTHTIEEILKERNKIDIINKKKEDIPKLYEQTIIFVSNQKQEYDSIPESKIEEYIQLSWENHKNRNMYSKTLPDTNQSIQLIRESNETEKIIKSKIKNQLKHSITLFGPIILSIDSIMAIISLVVQDPKFIQLGLLGSLVTVVIMGLDMLSEKIIYIRNKNQAIKILQKNGVYENVVKAIEAEEKKIALINSGKGRK